jgi:hypothetical protein
MIKTYGCSFYESLFYIERKSEGGKCMNLINESVQHTKFGSGAIVDIEQGRVVVKFTEQQDKKSFIFPDAFEGFLKLDNAQIQKDVLKQLRQKKEQVVIEKNIKMQETKKREEEIKEEKLELAKSKKKTTKAASAKKKMA